MDRTLDIIRFAFKPTFAQRPVKRTLRVSAYTDEMLQQMRHLIKNLYCLSTKRSFSAIDMYRVLDEYNIFFQCNHSCVKTFVIWHSQYMNIKKYNKKK